MLVKLSDICDIIPGYAFKGCDFSNDGANVVKITDITPPNVDTVNCSKVNLSNYNLNKLEKFKIKSGDYIIAMTGATIGKLGKVSSGEAYLNQRVAKFCPTGINKQYLYYVLSTNCFNSFIMNNIDSSSAQPNISSSSIGRYTFDCHDEDSQLHIVNILGSIDDKIENLETINNKLLYFMKNKFNKIYSNLNMDKQTTISNQLDCMISGDWGKDKLEKNYQSCVKCIRGADIPNAKLCNYNNIPERYILEKNNLKCKLKTYDIIIELSGGSPTQSTGRCCIIPENVLNKYDTNFISTNFCKVLRFKNKEMAVFSYLLLSYWYDSNLFFNYEIGTTGLKNLNLDAIINFDIKQPNIKILNEIFNYFNVCYNQIVENAEKLKKLNQLKQLYLKKFFG